MSRNAIIIIVVLITIGVGVGTYFLVKSKNNSPEKFEFEPKNLEKTDEVDSKED